jgi:phenylpropionate dioxygenase-like ring-hydroxylating dioxygenase large terminal subunit
VQEILDRERTAVPAALREESPRDLGSRDIPKDRYLSRAFHALEVERMWRRVWQMACREEEIPRVGDYVVYEIGDDSLVVVRAGEREIRAFHNACLHRGRTLCTEDGHAAQLRCPFHGFTWRLDGSLKHVPCRWDFPQIEDDAFRLPEAKVGTWGGFVFVNLDPQAGPLEDYLAPVPEHFRAWALEERFKAVHVAKVIAMNWKVGVEAFIESYHVIGTHPQILSSTADCNTQYDVYDNPHVNRMITPMAAPSPHLGDGVPEQQILNAITSGYANQSAEPGALRLPEGQTARAFLGEMSRQIFAQHASLDVSRATDSEMLDAIQYFVFPNFFPWGGYPLNIVYRFRPWRNEPEQALMEVMLLRPLPKDGTRPPPAKMRLLRDDERWTDAPELGVLAPVFEQDMNNMPWVQRGLRASRKAGVTLSVYQESRIRHLHRTLDAYLARP